MYTLSIKYIYFVYFENIQCILCILQNMYTLYITKYVYFVVTYKTILSYNVFFRLALGKKSLFRKVWPTSNNWEFDVFFGDQNRIFECNSANLDVEVRLDRNDSFRQVSSSERIVGGRESRKVLKREMLSKILFESFWPKPTNSLAANNFRKPLQCQILNGLPFWNFR